MLELAPVALVIFLVGFAAGRWRTKAQRELWSAGEAARTALHAASQNQVAFAEIAYDATVKTAKAEGYATGPATSWLGLSKTQRAAVLLLASSAVGMVVDEARLRREREERAPKWWLRWGAKLLGVLGEAARLLTHH